MEFQKKILVTGGSGFIGSKLISQLLKDGYQVLMLGRTKPVFSHPHLTFFRVDLLQDDLGFLSQEIFHGVIHLAGQPIFGRWTRTFKQNIYDSRIISTQRLVAQMSQMSYHPEVFVTASGFGYYGHCGQQLVDENRAPGEDFLAQVCIAWEDEAKKIESLGVRTVQLRTAHVLGDGGLLAPLFTPFSLGLGGWFGKGEAWFPWIHLEDLIGIYGLALKNTSLRGPVNAVAPETVDQKTFMQMLGKVIGKRARFSIPLAFLRLFYGDLAGTFDQSVKLIPEKLRKLNYKFKYPRLNEALTQICEGRKLK